jgi:hypothetical protein
VALRAPWRMLDIEKREKRSSRGGGHIGVVRSKRAARRTQNQVGPRLAPASVPGIEILGALLLTAARFPQLKRQPRDETHVVDAAPVGSGGAPAAAGGWSTAGGAGGGAGGEGGVGGLGGSIATRGHSAAGATDGQAFARSERMVYTTLAHLPPQEPNPFAATALSPRQGLSQLVADPFHLVARTKSVSP